MELRCSGEQTEFESKKMVGPSQRAIEELEASVESDSVSELDLSNSRKSTSTGTSKTGEAEDEVKIELAKRETVVVNRLRFLVFLILLLAAVSVSIIVYYITSEAERQEFENQYEGAADKILSEFVDGVKLKLGAAASLGVAAVAYGVDHSIRWPFVTVVRICRSLVLPDGDRLKSLPFFAAASDISYFFSQASISAQGLPVNNPMQS